VIKRLSLLGTAFALVWTILVARVAYIQVFQSSHYRGIAEGQSIARDVLPPARGEVYDRQGTRLVVNVRGAAALNQVRADRGAKASVVAASAVGSGRLSPNGPLAGQVIGMVGRDGYGQSGIELHLDRDLRGTDGWRYTRRDAKRRYAPGAADQIQPPIDGMAVHLTIDARIQSVAELALERAVLRTGAKSGVAVVVDPRSGDILAMANYPLFDPNAPRERGGENWRNNAIAMVYEPGSTFKVFTAAALVEERRIKPTDTVDAEGGRWQIGGHWIRDTHAMDRVSFSEAVAHSSNIVFAKTSTRISQESFYKYLRSFGFGMKTGVSLPAEESGLLKPVSAWSGRTQQTIAFGHEVSTTPLQLAMAFAAIANDGVLMRPRLVQSWVDDQGRVNRTEPTRSVRRVLSPATAASVREMMTGVVDHGTARDIRHPYIPMAGKTGSAQKINPQTGRYIEGSYYASFAGMAPAENPSVVAVVVIDDPKQFKFGGQAAGPVFREIIDRISERGLTGTWPSPPPAVMVEAPSGAGTVASAEASPPSETLRGAQNRNETSVKSSAVRTALASFRLGKSESPAANPAVQGSAASHKESAARRLDHTEMPDLQNATLRDALGRLRTLGIEVEYEGAGRVKTQVPAPGTPMKRGDRAQLSLGWAG
jgi:cell division protein FtsI/penicillin-binding protein 2